jgi:hypothetical protein
MSIIWRYKIPSHHWYSYRLTASLIELFLYSKDVPRHRVLTLFVEHLTGFKITDAVELEAAEPPISPDLLLKFESYGPLTELDRLFQQDVKNSLWNISFTDSWTDRIFNRRGIDRKPS